MASDTTDPKPGDDTEDNDVTDQDEHQNETLPTESQSLGSDGADDNDEDAPDSEDIGPGQHDNNGGLGATLAPGNDMPATTATVGVADNRLQKLSIMHDLSQEAVYLMGLSFLLGSLFTIFILLVLDFMRRNNDNDPIR